MTLDDIRDSSCYNAAMSSSGSFPVEKTSVSIHLKWLPQTQFMGYYVALDKGYYKDAGLDVTMIPGGRDIGETTAVYTGQVDFGVTWVSNLIAANAGSMSPLWKWHRFSRDPVWFLSTKQTDFHLPEIKKTVRGGRLSLPPDPPY